MKKLVSLFMLVTGVVQAASAMLPGERLVKNACVQCHTFGRDEPNGAGPALFGLLGRPAGSASGFTYSASFVTAMKGKVWDAALLERWLTDTQAVAPGNGMSYFEDDRKKRAEIIRYIQTLK